MKKTRYLQLNSIMMLEYELLGEQSTPDNDFHDVERFNYTKLVDGHYCIYSPMNMEVSFDGDKPELMNEPVTHNTLNHLAVPKDKKDAAWYTFIDNGYEYCQEDEFNSVKYKQYEKYLTNPIDPDRENKVEVLTVSARMRYDTIKLYFVNGYDFADMMGVLCRIFVETTKPGKPMLDLCNFFLTKATAYKMVKYTTDPIIVNSQIYDRYIEIKVPCLTDICVNDGANPGAAYINSVLQIKDNAPRHIMMSSIEDGDFEITEVNETDSDNKLQSVIRRAYTNKPLRTNRLTNCNFFQSSTLNGAIPTESLTSDRLGVYIAENKDLHCIEFCSTWLDSAGKMKPLDFDTVSMFNHGIFLYDRSLIKEYSQYEIDDDYEVDDSVSIHNWVVMHTLTLSYVDENNNVNEATHPTETYTMMQDFGTPNARTIFYYKPLFTDPGDLERTYTIHVTYTARLMNTRDMVQFYNNAALSLIDPNLYYTNTAVTGYTDLIPFHIYNKIIENKHEVKKNVSIVPKIKYVKTFYNSTDVVLEGSDGTYYSSDNIVVHFSKVPKNYKFVIKNRQFDNVYDYMDLTEGYYKLYCKDAGGNEIIIDPTYSSNMNMLLGELEFNLSSSVLNLLQQVDPSERTMSIIVYNEDNSVSSLFDFTYEF